MDGIDGLVKACSNSSALSIELLQSCTKPSVCAFQPFSHDITVQRAPWDIIFHHDSIVSMTIVLAEYITYVLISHLLARDKVVVISMSMISCMLLVLP